MTTPIERAAEAIRTSNIEQGVADISWSLSSEWGRDIDRLSARAVFESIDFEELRDVVGHIWNPSFLAVGIKAYLLGEQP